MGYFDALGSGSFKTGPNGRKLFFPWGVLGRGYTIDSEQDYQRLRRQVKGYLIISMVLILTSNLLEGYLASLAIGGPLIGFYLIWMWFFLRRLKRSDERLSLQESMTSQARAHSMVGLWLMEIGSIAFVACGIFMFVVAPNIRLIALASIFFFGLCAASFARMLVLRRRTAVTQP